MGREKIMTCPLCGSLKTKRLTSSTFNIMVCKTCTNAWTTPIPRLRDYSKEDFHRNTLRERSQDNLKNLNDLPVQWRNSIIMQTKLLTRHLRPTAKILEIGCGEGLLLSELNKLGFNVQGIEPSKSGSDRAREKGLNVITGCFSEFKIRQHFDAVILSHVLEHLHRPLDMLEKVAELIPQGYLLLVQSHYRGLIAQMYNSNWYAWSAQEHYWHFTPKGLFRLCQQLGYHFVVCDYSSLVHSGYLTKLVSRIAFFAPQVLDQFHLLLRKL